MIEMRLRSKVSPEELEQKVGKILTHDDYNVLVTRATRILKPDGKPLLVYLPGALGPDVLDSSYGTLHAMKSMVTDNRQMASGSQPVVDGTRRRSKQVASAIIGAFDASPPFTYCRLTAFNKEEGEKFSGLTPMFSEIGRLFAEHVPDRYAVQMQHVGKTEPDWVVPGTPFTTITVNNTYPTGVHTDKGDLDEGFSTLAVLRKGSYSGGNLVFPEYRVAVDMHHGDVLLMDAHEWHGNVGLQELTPECDWCRLPAKHEFDAYRPDTGKLVSKPVCEDHMARINQDGSIKVIEQRRIVPMERISVVCYYRTKMKDCGTAEEEEQRHLATAARRTGVEEKVPVEAMGA